MGSSLAGDSLDQRNSIYTCIYMHMYILYYVWVVDVCFFSIWERWLVQLKDCILVLALNNSYGRSWSVSWCLRTKRKVQNGAAQAMSVPVRQLRGSQT